MEEENKKTVNKNPNLKNFQKGEQRTRDAGRKGGKKSKRKPLHEELQSMLDEGGKLEELLNVAIKKARSGNLKALDFVFDRAYGKAKQSIELDVTAEISTPNDLLKSLSEDKLDQMEKWLFEAQAQLEENDD